jgi:hypothetical protein
MILCGFTEIKDSHFFIKCAIKLCMNFLCINNFLFLKIRSKLLKFPAKFLSFPSERVWHYLKCRIQSKVDGFHSGYFALFFKGTVHNEALLLTF